MGRSYGGGRSRERIDARAALSNVRTTPHIHHRRPNGWVDRGPNWYKHSFGQWEEVMGVGDREFALIRALRAQTCAQHHLSSIGARRSGPIESQIGTKTHWGMDTSYGVCVQPSRASAERENEREALEYRDGTGRRNCREREVRVWGARISRVSQSNTQNSCIFSERHRC
jgi:hypothetical protein